MTVALKMTLDEHKELNNEYVYRKFDEQWRAHTVYIAFHKHDLAMPPGSMIYSRPVYVLEKDGVVSYPTFEEEMEIKNTLTEPDAA